MERPITLIAAIGAFLAASIAAYAAIGIKDSFQQQVEDSRKRQALADLDTFDKDISRSVVGFPCLALTASLDDEAAISALFSGSKFVGPAVAGCREKDRKPNEAGAVSYASNDARSIRRQTIKLLAAHEAVFAHVHSGLSDCATVETRFGTHLTEHGAAYRSALERAEQADKGAVFPAFKAYLTGGCAALN